MNEMDYDFENGNWNRCIGTYTSDEHYCFDFADPVRMFDLRVDTCQAFNREAGKTTWMHAVVLRPKTYDSNGDVVDAYSCFSGTFPTQEEAFEKAVEVMKAVDAGEYDDDIIDNLAMGRAKRLATSADQRVNA